MAERAFAADLALFAARLVLLLGQARALRLVSFRFLRLLGRLVFARGHCEVDPILGTMDRRS